jgi:acyl-CoA reductase-like NAD-dependent aldehyde dehydrogenase
VQSTFNNTIVTITDTNGETIAWAQALLALDSGDLEETLGVALKVREDIDRVYELFPRLAERLTSHQSPSSCTTCQWRAATAMAMKAGATSRVKELAALSSMEKARNRWRRQSQRLPRARRSLRQVLRDQRSRCRKKVRPSVGKVDQTLAELVRRAADLAANHSARRPRPADDRPTGPARPARPAGARQPTK